MLIDEEKRKEYNNKKAAKYRVAHPEKIKATAARWRDKNREVIKEANKTWNLSNKEYRKKYNSEYWENKEERNQYMKDRYDPKVRSEYYLKRRHIAMEEGRAWSRTPKGRALKRASWQRYKARQLKAEGSFTADDIKDLYATQGGRCYYCSVEIENGYHIEHMTPLSRGGKNDVSNICLACAPCNLSKHTKTAEEFQGER